MSRLIRGMILLISTSYFVGCGAVVGTVVGNVQTAVAYPFSEYVFWGAFEYDNTWETPYQELEEDEEHGDTLLGLAVSGGGSRSAYFMSCVMEELAQKKIVKGNSPTYMDEVDYISSVSGGSLASAYYCSKVAYARDKKKFLREFREAMGKNFEVRSLLRMVFFGYWALDFFTYYDRGDLLAAVWESNFFGDLTFEDLQKAQHKGAPTLIINGTDLSDGRKFVFSTLPESRFNNSEFFQTIEKYGFEDFSGYRRFKTKGFQSLNSDIRPYRVSKAVAASASVPNLIGPVTLKNYQGNYLINICDGGVYDNSGVESLIQVFTEYLDGHPGKPAKIIIIDGSGFFEKNHNYSDNQSIAYYSERPLSISWKRMDGYLAYVFEELRKFTNRAGQRPYRNLQYSLISLYDVLPSQEGQKQLIKVNEAALGKILNPHLTALDFFNEVTNIQTRFKVSATDAHSIEDVATEVVQKMEFR